MTSEDAISRRTLLKAGAAAGAGLAALGSPMLSSALNVGKAEAASLSGTLTWGTWNDLKADSTAKSPSRNALTLLHFVDEYKKVQPGVTVKLVFESADPRTWLQTQIIAGSGPDVGWDWVQGGASLYANVKNIVDFAPLLEQKNPYSTNAKWKQDFLLDSLQQNEDTSGHIWAVNNGILGLQGGTAFVYNQTILDKLKLGSPLKWTWDEFLAKLAVVRQKSTYIPFVISAGGSGAYPLDWTFNLMLCALWDPGLFQKLMSLKVSPKDIQVGYQPSQKQLVYAVKKGLFSFTDPHVLDVLRLMKQWSAYWQPGFLSPLVGDPFSQGKAAFSWVLGAQYNTVNTFNWGTMLPPPITKASSSYGTGIAWRSLATSGSPVRVDTPYFIPQSTVKKGHLPLALDFVQFMTAPAQQAYYNMPGKNNLTSVKPGTPLEKIFPDPKMQMRQRGFWDASFLRRPGWQPVDTLGNAAYVALIQQLGAFLSGGESAEQCAQAIQSVAMKQVQQIIESNPDWNASGW